MGGVGKQRKRRAKEERKGGKENERETDRERERERENITIPLERNCPTIPRVEALATSQATKETN